MIERQLQQMAQLWDHLKMAPLSREESVRQLTGESVIDYYLDHHEDVVKVQAVIRRYLWNLKAGTQSAGVGRLLMGGDHVTNRIPKMASVLDQATLQATSQATSHNS